MTDYQANQLRRLKAHVAAYGQPLAVVASKSVHRHHVPQVWRDLEDLGAVTITISNSHAAVAPIVSHG